MRYIGGINNPSYDPLALNVTTGVSTVQDSGVFTSTSVAQAIANGQWVGDPYFNESTLLLQADNSVNGAQNNTFLDSSTANSGVGWSVTRNGNTSQGTYNPFSVPAGYWSYSFSTGYLTANGSANLAIGTNNFTIECFIYPAAVSGSLVIYDSRPAGTASGAYPYLYANMTAGTIIYYVSGAIRITSAPVIRPFTWYHVSICRITNTTYLSINAVLQSQTWADSTNYLNGASRPAIGSDGNSIGTNQWNGYISNLRVNIGTSAGVIPTEVPTEPLIPFTDTQLLTCQNNRVIDNGQNNVPLTIAGTFAPRPFTFFNNLPPYNPLNNSGGIYFDGSGDSLSVADNVALELGTNDFCFECFFYATTTSATGSILQKRSGTAVMPINIWRSTSTIQVYMSSVTNGDIVGGGTGVAIGTITTNQWYHVAVYRIGTAIYGSLNGTITTLNASTSQSVLNNGDPYTFGMNGNGTSDPWTGYMSNIRLVIGSSVYTAFDAPIPTAPLTNITNTKILLGATNSNITDTTIKNEIETAGNAQVSTVVKKYGSGSMSFDGTGDWLLIPHNADLNFGTGNFTIECWLNLSNTTVTRSLIAKGTSSTTGWEIYFNAAPTLFIFAYGASISYSSNYNLNQGQWYHLAVTRSGTGTNNLKMFIDGFLIHEGTVTSDLSTTGNMYVGASRVGAGSMSGYVDDLRITKGVARYTANFIPPVAAFSSQGVR